MSKHNRKCICCNTVYSYCPSCSGPDRLKPSWYSEFCCESCKDLWSTATKFNMGLIDKAEAKNIISNLSLKDKSEYVNSVQRDIEHILKEEPKPITRSMGRRKHEVVTKKEE